ncbi:hypothetical protein A2810_02605 [candidate division Kazan bacterium RIFCSPHIGHO2_01_FULL_49_10]|uniref:Glycosyltransferase RgtA/B/C/D-like domain-containing protein n=1 Tax=candidate division Kazan bacterium RIFCSPLOWO2_01_FULL_48_13 TaxID=1798539 RepID=A0A1F4PPY7_UNCK3|nr:MAG: hypothetical protein A2810_02605 [candidate division Kazan bacterium RIFCSPHIGHO2_01_FULL_49_10]OGB85718.1 MAG: hypothetical protein A2994_03110 [candidate division Kazan bacterium RIFCSPLOWO2_01_FULL_48_13]
MYKLLKKIDWERRVFALPTNWAGALTLVALWAYGFFGALSSDSHTLNLFISLILLSIYLLFLFVWQKQDPLFKDRLVIKMGDVWVVAILFVFLFIFSWSALAIPLVNDELAHAQQAELHGLSLIYLLVGGWGWLNGLTFAGVLWVINVAALVLGIVSYLFLKQKGLWLKLVAFSSVFILFRLLIMGFGGSGGQHPPFRLFPLWLSGTILSPSDFSFRFAQFIGLVIFGWLIWRFIEKRAGHLLALLIAMTAVTIPVLWYVGVLVGPSIWTTMAWSLVLLYMYLKPNLIAKDFLRLVAIVSIATLMRQTAFVALVPIFLRLAYDLWKRGLTFREVLLISSPLLVMVPFLLISFISGTPASYVPGATSYFPPETSGLGRVWFALSSGLAWTAIRNSVQPLWLVFGGVSLICLLKTPRRFLENIFFLAGGVGVFYLISPLLWGNGRYQAEYIIPFSILGLIMVIIFLREKVGWLKYHLLLGALVMIGYNTYSFIKIPRLNAPVNTLISTRYDLMKKLGEYSIISQLPYDYRSAMTAAKDSNYADSLYIVGSTYGVFPQILDGFTIGEAIANKKLLGKGGLLRNESGDLTPADINSNKDIKLVLVSDVPNANYFLDQLTSLGWVMWEEFKDERFGSTIFGLIRE